MAPAVVESPSGEATVVSRGAATITRFERCPACTDGSCRACGSASAEHAAPGVRLVVRQVRFIACVCESGCALCGPNVHELAAPGVTIEIVEEHDAKRWVPVVHLNKNGNSACGTAWIGAQTTSSISEVTCRRCLKWNKGVR